MEYSFEEYTVRFKESLFFLIFSNHLIKTNHAITVKLMLHLFCLQVFAYLDNAWALNPTETL